MAIAEKNATIKVQSLPAPRARGRQVSYAEELGLTSLPIEAKGAAEALGVMYHMRAQFEAKIRDIKSAVGVREYSLAENLRDVNPEASNASFERSLKMLVGADDNLRTLNDELLNEQAKLGELEAEIKANEVIARTSQSQMKMLGGYFEYLAASKESATVDKVFGQIP